MCVSLSLRTPHHAPPTPISQLSTPRQNMKMKGTMPPQCHWPVSVVKPWEAPSIQGSPHMIQMEHDLNTPLNESHNVDDPSPLPHHSHWQTTLTACGAAMRGLSHVSRTEHAVNKVRESTRHAHETRSDAHASIDTDHWIPISKSVMLSSDSDPK